MYGLYHRATLSTPILIKIIHDLICHDFFYHHSSQTHLDLELHLQCIIASLRLLSAHGIQDGTGTLAFPYFDELYNRMSVWQSYHRGQVDRIKGVDEATKNYNNEFLIVYARDLISSVPSDRTVATNVATRMIAAASALGHAVTYFDRTLLINSTERTLCKQPNHLKTVKVKHPPSAWHTKYRTMDDLCLSVRVFRQLNEKIPLPGNEWMENLPDFLETAEENVINQLSDILYEELQNGFSKDKIGPIVRGGGDAIGTAPLARKDHFIYGIPHLIQQHIQPIDSGKVNYKVMEFSLDVAKNHIRIYDVKPSKSWLR